MNLKVEIDSASGFCYGVIRAIKRAESSLSSNDSLYSLGAIVHNNSELERLNKIGLKVIDLEQMSHLHGTTVLIRAHGEPPSTYSLAKQNEISLIDCTCPVVLRLQDKIREVYGKKGDGEIIIFGKKGHAEVNGLVGQVNSDAIVIESIKDIDKIDFTKQLYLFSQTTKDPNEYLEVYKSIVLRVKELGFPAENVKYFNTICRLVSQRHTNLVKFAKEHSVIIFVSGKESSNGKVLYQLCKSVNSRTYNIQEVSQVDWNWFKEGDSVGICGATSTPKWQLEMVASFLLSPLNP